MEGKRKIFKFYFFILSESIACVATLRVPVNRTTRIFKLLYLKRKFTTMIRMSISNNLCFTGKYKFHVGPMHYCLKLCANDKIKVVLMNAMIIQIVN